MWNKIYQDDTYISGVICFHNTTRIHFNRAGIDENYLILTAMFAIWKILQRIFAVLVWLLFWKEGKWELGDDSPSHIKKSFFDWKQCHEIIINRYAVENNHLLCIINKSHLEFFIKYLRCMRVCLWNEKSQTYVLLFCNIKYSFLILPLAHLIHKIFILFYFFFVNETKLFVLIASWNVRAGWKYKKEKQKIDFC